MENKKRGRGHPRKIESPEIMEDLWERFKEDCDNQTVIRTEFSQKLGEFVTQTIPSPVSYTVLGFCCFIDLSRNKFYDTYKNDPAYGDIVSRIERECEQDVRKKFENKTIPSQLSALWMSKFGYSVKNEQEIKGNIPVVISGEDDLSD